MTGVEPRSAWSFDPWNLDRDVLWEGRRILLLGESHYNDGPQLNDTQMRSFTGEVVRDWSGFTGGPSNRFLRNVFETTTGRAWEQGSPWVAAFWNGVYFYNYVQAFVGDGPRQRPTAAQWLSAAEPFHAVLTRIAPDVVVVFGRALWNAMAAGESRGPSLMGLETRGGTVHIPARDSRSADEGPPQALSKAREQTAQESLAAATAGEEGEALFRAFCKELDAGHLAAKVAGDRAGSSLMKFEALNWRERLSRVVELERRCGNARMVKAVQAMMGRLSDAELTLRRVQHPDEEVLCADEIYWLIAMYPISRR